MLQTNFSCPKAFKFYFRDVIPNTIGELWRPHVVIYMDKPAEDCLKTIKEKGKVIIVDIYSLAPFGHFLFYSFIGKDFEKNSKVYSLDLLNSVEKNYKKNFLPSVR